MGGRQLHEVVMTSEYPYSSAAQRDAKSVHCVHGAVEWEYRLWESGGLRVGLPYTAVGRGIY
jgi:hypothetical protein